MEPRVINFRISNYQSQVKSLHNVSVNYYPVTSAIAIRDRGWKNQMTVMTTRTMGGSVIRTGTIELMQSRRLNFDDNYRKGVILSESEEVTATYFLQIFDRDFEQSH